MQPVAEVLVVCDGRKEDEKAELAHMDCYSPRHPSAILPYPSNPGYLQELANVQPDHAVQWLTFLKLIHEITCHPKYSVVNQRIGQKIACQGPVWAGLDYGSGINDQQSVSWNICQKSTMLPPGTDLIKCVCSCQGRRYILICAVAFDDSS